MLIIYLSLSIVYKDLKLGYLNPIVIAYIAIQLVFFRHCFFDNIFKNNLPYYPQKQVSQRLHAGYFLPQSRTVPAVV